jgi:TetR/AcrR family transcriptional repressor of mexAB-oprM operon
MAKPRDTRTVILETARELFIRQGYAATAMSQVARRTGIAKATIYHHFPDKRGLIDELVAQAMALMARTLDALARERDPGARLSLAAVNALGFLSRYADIMQVARREVPGARDHLKTDGGRILRAYETLIAEAVSDGRRQGIFRNVDPNDAARIFMTMVQGSFAHAMFSGSVPRSSGKAADALLDVFLHGIAAVPSRSKSRRTA